MGGGQRGWGRGSGSNTTVLSLRKKAALQCHCVPPIEGLINSRSAQQVSGSDLALWLCPALSASASQRLADTASFLPSSLQACHCGELSSNLLHCLPSNFLSSQGRPGQPGSTLLNLQGLPLVGAPLFPMCWGKGWGIGKELSRVGEGSFLGTHCPLWGLRAVTKWMRMGRGPPAVPCAWPSGRPLTCLPTLV